MLRDCALCRLQRSHPQYLALEEPDTKNSKAHLESDLKVKGPISQAGECQESSVRLTGEDFFS